MTENCIAIFDLDETLTKKGTWGRFVMGVVRGQPLKWLPFFFSTIFSQARYMLGLGPRERVKENMMRWTISGQSRSDLEKMAQAFADNEIATGLRNNALKVLEKHRDAGDRLIIASAAVDLVIFPIADHLKIFERVCTKTAFDKNDKLTRRLGGTNCYGPNKLELVKEFLEEDPNFDRDKVHITMYSDSSSDLAILQWADVGVAVNPSPKLAKCVEEYGFEVQDWDQD